MILARAQQFFLSLGLHFPSQHKRYTFMHNGGIPRFDTMKRQLLSLLGDEAYEAIEGTTDSEVWRRLGCVRLGRRLARMVHQ